jgi:hypothetical protein
VDTDPNPASTPPPESPRSDVTRAPRRRLHHPAKRARVAAAVMSATAFLGVGGVIALRSAAASHASSSGTTASTPSSAGDDGANTWNGRTNGPPSDQLGTQSSSSAGAGSHSTSSHGS